jgi:hypothetical protein
VRGSAYQVYEKYVALGRDALSSGDRVAAETFFQHAEHYFRVLNDSTDPQSNGQVRPRRGNGEMRQSAPEDAEAQPSGETLREGDAPAFLTRKRNGGGEPPAAEASEAPQPAASPANGAEAPEAAAPAAVEATAADDSAKPAPKPAAKARTRRTTQRSSTRAKKSAPESEKGGESA